MKTRPALSESTNLNTSTGADGAQSSAAPCCSPAQQSACCAPEAKSACCGTPDPAVTPATRCGCR